ncbi:MAG: hypothetical protein HYT98_01805 [Candidatus Sungbacteria bacterium]|nr:hypothetical protein [Candidatus Sungbacteria bacterium]
MKKSFKWKRNIRHAILKELTKVRPAVPVKKNSLAVYSESSSGVIVIRKKSRKHVLSGHN